MDPVQLQKQLESEIKLLRSNLKRQETKVKNLEEKENKLGEDRKRKHQDDQNNPENTPNKVINPIANNKRIRSVVVTKNDVKTDRIEAKEDAEIKPDPTSPTSPPAAAAATATTAAAATNTSTNSSSTVGSSSTNNSTAANENKRESRRSLAGSGDKIRDRRLLNALLVGTLNSFKKSEEEQSRTTEKRKEVEKKIEEKETTKNLTLREQQKQEIQEERKKSEEEAQAIREQIKLKEEELLKLKADQHEQELSFFVKTKAHPPIYFFPSKTDEFTEKTLGTKPRPVTPPATSANTAVTASGTGAAQSNNHRRTDEKTGNTGTDATDVDGDVVVEEITRAPEDFSGVHREEPSQEDIEDNQTTEGSSKKV